MLQKSNVYRAKMELHIKMRGEERNSIWIARVSRESFVFIDLHLRACSVVAKINMEGHRYQTTNTSWCFSPFSILFSDRTINTNLRFSLRLQFCFILFSSIKGNSEHLVRYNFIDDTKYRWPLHASQILNPYGW